MAEEDEEASPPGRQPGDGVRIIGAEEASAAVEAGGARRRPPASDEVPPPPPPARQPTLRFPIEEPDETEAAYGPEPGERVSGTGPMPDLPHWTEPPTGEVPRILADTPAATDDPAWAGYGGAARWRDSGQDWNDAELGDASALADDETRLGALDTSRSEVSDLYTFDDEATPPPTQIRTRSSAENGGGGGRGAPRAGRDNTQAVLIGVGLGALFLIFAALGPKYLLVLAAVVVVFLNVELFAVLRQAGYKPATLLGLVATLALMFGNYWKGERAIPLIVVLVTVFTFLWYLAGVVRARPTVNIAATLMAFLWAGLLGSYAGLLLRPSTLPGHGRDGVAFLVAAVLLTVVNDVIAYVAGQAFGRTALAPAVSPHKTWEGFAVAFIATALCGAGIVGQIHPFTVKRGLALGLVIAVVAPLGDLSESMVKRDIGLKDMGHALPGHGGLADRFDGLLFALPATYYLLQFMKVV
jgi:phosphatidate cytidylyltransferase